MRGWLACKQSGLEFEELIVPLYDEAWEKRREGDEFAPSLGKVPVLWDGDCVVWDSLAIIDFLADRVGRDKFWPADDAARGMARSMAAEMHSGFANLRRELPMNVRKNFGEVALSSDVEAEVVRILNLWAQARARFGGSGEYLFGDWCAADMMYAPVVARYITYGVAVPPFAAEVGKARMHFGGHRARHSARGIVVGPEFIAADSIGEEFDDRDRIPHHAIAIPQHRHLAERGREFIAFAALFPILVEHRDDQLLELELRLPTRKPAAHRPGRIGTIADNQLHVRAASRIAVLNSFMPSPVSLEVANRVGCEAG